jgi:hypothetical protein
MILISDGTFSATIDGSVYSCSRVVIFGGQKGIGQSRSSPTDRADPANYLETGNYTAFVAHTGSLVGKSSFDWRSPEVDIIKCYP